MRISYIRRPLLFTIISGAICAFLLTVSISGTTFAASVTSPTICASDQTSTYAWISYSQIVHKCNSTVVETFTSTDSQVTFTSNTEKTYKVASGGSSYDQSSTTAHCGTDSLASEGSLSSMTLSTQDWAVPASGGNYTCVSTTHSVGLEDQDKAVKVDTSTLTKDYETAYTSKLSSLYSQWYSAHAKKCGSSTGCIEGLESTWTNDVNACTTYATDSNNIRETKKTADTLFAECFAGKTGLDEATIAGKVAGAYDSVSTTTTTALTASTTDTTPTTSCNIDVTGWILCPLITTGANFASDVLKFLSDNFLSIDTTLLNTNSNLTVNGTKVGTGTYTAWKVMLSIGNALLIIAFLVIIFSQLTSIGVTNYGIKKILPRLILAAVLINISFYLCQVAVDLSNILGYSLNGLFTTISEQVVRAQGSTVSAADQSNNIVTLAAAAITVAIISWVNIAAVILAIVGAIITLLSVFLLLVIRKALIILLVVLAPIAFAAFVLPNTQSLFKKWWKTLSTLLLLFPIIGLVYGGSRLASTILLQAAGSDTLLKTVAYLALVLPLVAILPLLKGSLSAVGTLGGKVQSMANGVKGTTQGQMKRGQEAYKNSGYGRFRAARRQDRKARISAGTYRGAGGGWNPRNWGTRINQGLNNNSKFNLVTGGYGANRDLAAQAQNRKDMQDVMATFGNDDKLASAWALSGGDLKHPAVAALDLDDTQKAQFEKMRAAGHHRKATSFLAASQYLSENGKGDAATVEAALTNAGQVGASETDVSGARQAAIASYRKSGRGDALADLSTIAGTPLTQAEGWGQVTPSSVHRDGITLGSTGRTAYETHLNSDRENTRKALAGYDAMEARAQASARSAIIAAAQSHELAATGATTITDIQQAKTYFGVK